MSDDAKGDLPIGPAVFRRFIATAGLADLHGRLFEREATPSPFDPAQYELPPNIEMDAAQEPEIAEALKRVLFADTSDAYVFSDVEIDVDRAEYTYRWRSVWIRPDGNKVMYEHTPSHHYVVIRPWERRAFERGIFNPRDRDHPDKLFRRAADAWEYMAKRFRADLIAGREKAVGRIGSPLTPSMSPISPDAWNVLEIDDWEKGVANDTTGQKVFTITVLGGESTKLAPRKPTTKRERVVSIFAEIYPTEGFPPDALTDQSVMSDVTGVWEMRFGKPAPGIDTIRRARNRRAD